MVCATITLVWKKIRETCGNWKSLKLNGLQFFQASKLNKWLRKSKVTFIIATLLSKGIYIVGLVFTLSAFYVNFARYFRHESTLSHRKSEKIFLKIVEENYKQSYFFYKKSLKNIWIEGLWSSQKTTNCAFPDNYNMHE